MLRPVNRVLLGLAGAVLLMLGFAALAGGFDLQHRWGFSLGSGWPWASPDDVVLTDSARRRWRSEGWWWPAVIGGLSLALLLAGWWLLVHLRRRRLGGLQIDSGDGKGALLRGRALQEALAADAMSLNGVERARVALHGHATRPSVRMSVTLGAHAEPATVMEDLRTKSLEHARTSAGLEAIPAEIRLRAVSHRAERVT